MPHWLKFVALCGPIFGPIIVSAPFLPGGWTNAETGEVISTDDFWRKGMAIEVILSGVCLMLASICVFRRINCVRFLIPLTFFSSAVYCYFRPDIASATDMYGALVWTALSGWYLLLKSNVKKYFQQETEQAMRGNRR